MKCPICAQRARPDFVKDGCRIDVCGACRHRFAHIEPSPRHTSAVYGDDYFFAGGSGYLDYTGEADLLVAHGARYADLLQHHIRPGAMLDVGAAAGYILKGFLQKGWQGEGVEPNATMAARARQLGLAVETGTLEQYEAKQKFDLVTMIQVLAHFYDVRRSLEVARDVLREGGWLLVETWDRESLPARLLGTNWHHYSPPSVVNWFSKDGLRALVQQFGFEEVDRGRPAKWITGSHAKSLAKYKLEGIRGGSLLGRVFDLLPDKLQIPYPSLDLFWALFQKRQ